MIMDLGMMKITRILFANVGQKIVAAILFEKALDGELKKMQDNHVSNNIPILLSSLVLISSDLRILFR